MNFFDALVANPLLFYALLAGFAASVVSGVIGSYVVVKRISFISGSISHVVLGGIGFSIWCQRVLGIAWMSPFLGALLSAVGSALLIGWIQFHYKQREDSVIAALWSIGMAIGVIFISQTPGYNVELSNYLIGNLLWVSDADLVILWVLDLVILAIVYLFYKQFMAICFDEEHARLQGLPVQGLYMLLLVLIAITVVLLIQVVGVILVITLLTLPATIANLYFQKLSAVMAGAVILCALFSSVGTYLSYTLDWPPGASIALVAGATYVAVLSMRTAFSRR
jgi:zinc transport system permease protein